MKTLPLKWIKHLLLAEYGLSDMKSIEARISRFDIVDLQSFLSCIKETLIQDLKDYDEVLFVVKLVNTDAYYKLPNIRLRSLSDYYAMEELMLDPEFSTRHDEIWFCKNFRKSNKDVLCGRLCIYETFHDIKHVAECVLNTTPRMIESYNENVGVPYLRAERTNWSMRYNIADINVEDEKTIQIFTDLFVEAVKELERHRTSMCAMFDDLKMLDLDVASFEFIYDGSLQIIDWDTANDRLLIEKYQALLS
jgi:hypothetical protein